MDSVVLPDKLFFKIGEVAKLADVKQHVLRYWESEFSSIRPQKSNSNQRLYRRRDVEAVLAVKHLLYDLKFTIEGAKKHLKEEGIDESLPPPDIDNIVERTRVKALEQADEDKQQLRANLQSEYQRSLLGLRQELCDFLSSIETTETQ